MNSRLALFFQAARGPVLLITVGALAAVHQAGILSFWRSWPLLLIVVGVMKLLERVANPPRPVPPAGYPPQPPYGTQPPYPGAPVR